MSETAIDSTPIDSVAAAYDRAKENSAEFIGKTRENLEAQMGTAREKIEEVTTQVNEKLGGVQEEARKQATRARELAADQYAVRSEQFRESYGQVRENVAHASSDLEEFVRENPGRAVLIAAGAGFLLGLLFRGRSRD